MKYRIERTDGKDISGNTYLVINTDEPYAGEIADIIELNERKSGRWEHGEKSLREVMGIQNGVSELQLLRKIAAAGEKVCKECPVNIGCIPNDCWMWTVKQGIKDYQTWKEAAK